MSINGDMKGLMQIAGMAGPGGVFNCLFCLCQKNGTNVAGIPCLRHPPEGPWTAAHLARSLEVRDPPARGSTDEMAKLAADYQRDAAAPGAPKDLSSGLPKYQSCVAEPFFWSDDLIEHLSKMPLHVLLGIGVNRLNQIEAECVKLDEDWAMNSSTSEIVAAWIEANANIVVKEEDIESIQEQITTHEAAMLEIQTHEPARKSWNRGGIPPGDAGVFVRRWREENAAKKEFEDKMKKAKKELEQLRKTEEEKKAAALAAASTGPFATAFNGVLKELGISRKKYFGGTYEGPSLDTIFSVPGNIAKLCAVLRSREVECPDGRVVRMGSDARASAVESVLQAFGEAYRLFSRKDALCEHEIELFPCLVAQFMCRFATVYPNEQPTPKMHVLGWHYIEMMERHGSTGIDSEQGIEALHPEFNYVLNHFRALDRNKPAQLEAVYSRLCARTGGAVELKAPGLRDKMHEGQERSRERGKRKVGSF